MFYNSEFEDYTKKKKKFQKCVIDMRMSAWMSRNMLRYRIKKMRVFIINYKLLFLRIK